jgi:hypothetical protein
MEKPAPNKTNRELPPVADWVLAGVAIGCAYLAASLAIDSGSLLSYAAALVLLGLGVRHLMQGLKKVRGRTK